MVYANLAGYLVVAAGSLLLGTLFGSKLTTVAMSMLHRLETRLAALEGAAGANPPAVASGAEKHAAAIGAHASAVSKLADAIGKHALAVDDHGAATVAAAVETHAASLVVSK